MMTQADQPILKEDHVSRNSGRRGLWPSTDNVAGGNPLSPECVAHKACDLRCWLLEASRQCAELPM
jgi:hypothetical protein